MKHDKGTKLHKSRTCRMVFSEAIFKLEDKGIDYETMLREFGHTITELYDFGFTYKDYLKSIKGILGD